MAAEPRRIAILAEGHFSPMEAKTAIGLLRYRPESVVAVIDSERSGSTADACAGAGGEIPVVSTLGQAIERGANTLLIGIAPAGGRLPPPWRTVIEGALDAGLDIVSGLHTFLADDPELVARARARGVSLVDVRRPPAELPIGLARAARLEALVVLTVGTDCNVGKMTASLEMQRALAARSVRAAFVATGQTGIMIAGSGVAVDAVPSDFVAGAIEREVLAAASDHDIVVVEGQGSLHHPAYSAVALGLLHGTCPAALILCHHHGRSRMRIGSAPVDDGPPLPSLTAAREAAERAAAWVHAAPVVGVALNTWDTPEREALAACVHAADSLGVPVTDPIRFGAAPLAEALIEARAVRRASAIAH